MTGRLFIVLFFAVSGCRWEQDIPGPENHAPRAPVVSGPDTVVVGTAAAFDAAVLDPDGDRLRVYVAWGDGDTTDCGDFIPSGGVAAFEHSFTRPGSFEVTARCHDLEPLFSDWSAPHTVVALESE